MGTRQTRCLMNAMRQHSGVCQHLNIRSYILYRNSLNVKYLYAVNDMPAIIKGRIIAPYTLSFYFLFFFRNFISVNAVFTVRDKAIGDIDENTT